MGRRTFESLPKLLPNRKHIVLSSSNNFPSEVTVYKEMDELLKSLKDSKEELFVIGGASIYKLFLDYADKMYLTLIDAECSDADAFFPEYDKNDWTEEILGENEDNNIKYKHVLFKRKKR